MSPRLRTFDYLGPHRYALTCCAHERRKVFEDPHVVRAARDQLLRTADCERFAIPAYCFMPDHLHILAVGTGASSSLPALAVQFKRASGYGYARVHGRRLWQKNYWDRVLRSDAAMLSAMRYILQNPVRAGLVTSGLTYPWSGSQWGALEDILPDLDVQRAVRPHWWPAG